MPKLAANNSISDAEALALVMEMMAIPGRSGEEAAIMDFIRGKLIEAGVPQKCALLRRCESPDTAWRPGRQSGAETARHDSRPAANAFRTRRHGAHLCWFAPGAKGQIRRQRQQGNGARGRRPIRGGNPADDRAGHSWLEAAPSAAHVSVDCAGGSRPVRSPLRKAFKTRQTTPGVQLRWRRRKCIENRRDGRLSHDDRNRGPRQPRGEPSRRKASARSRSRRSPWPIW